MREERRQELLEELKKYYEFIQLQEQFAERQTTTLNQYFLMILQKCSCLKELCEDEDRRIIQEIEQDAKERLEQLKKEEMQQSEDKKKGKGVCMR